MAHFYHPPEGGNWRKKVKTRDAGQQQKETTYKALADKALGAFKKEHPEIFAMGTRNPNLLDVLEENIKAMAYYLAFTTNASEKPSIQKKANHKLSNIENDLHDAYGSLYTSRDMVENIFSKTQLFLFAYISKHPLINPDTRSMN